MRNKNDDEQKAIEVLKSRGWKLKRPGEYEKTSFVVYKPTLLRFRQCVSALKMQVQDAITEALDDWVAKRGKK